MLLSHFIADGFVDKKDFLMFAMIAAVMTLVGLVAAIAPARRGLRIQPMEALRHE